MKRLTALFICIILLLGCIPVSASTYIEKGNSIILHAESKWYIHNGDWKEASHVIEKDEYGNFYISVEDFKEIFKINIMYNHDDSSIFVLHEGREIWQGFFTPMMYVDKTPYPNPAAYLSPIDGAVMIPAEPYASVFGYIGVFSVEPTYAYGQLSLTIPDKNYTIDHIEVNKAMQMVVVYGKDTHGNVVPIKHFLCSTGSPLSLTPNGTFNAKPLSYYRSNPDNPWYYFAKSRCWILYCTQISGNICFHSVPINKYDISTLSKTGYNAIGNPASHGCVRLLVEDAKFIWENCKNVPVKISNGYYSDDLRTIKNKLQSARPTYANYIADLKTKY